VIPSCNSIFVYCYPLLGATFAKMSRPTKITRQIIFSEVAVINQSSISYKGSLNVLLSDMICSRKIILGGVDRLDTGSYEYGQEPVLTYEHSLTSQFVFLYLGCL
jgi:hypothetical protein